MISPEDYKFVSDELANARNDAGRAFGRLIDMQTNLTNSEVNNDDIEKRALAEVIDQTYLLAVTKYYQPNLHMLNIITELQNHVVHHHGDVNDFLSSNGILVLQDFADLSILAGFNIDITNIE
jgi:hypothetical protein|tara:strand:+ start:7865 stop:8233 length:369 start_codon:yes stop_codon:yes gene_type:complete